ncbi:hypothetical protein [Streptacidiphilus sp. MAP12-20]|uniref:hypothetical protein n=1 Tax=Streptacidiphilus sp. MAP12-20 TaxID=3156299 RepID=UPI003511E6D7
MAARSGQTIELVETDTPTDDLRTACGLRVHWGRRRTWVVYRHRPTVSQMRHTILHGHAHEWLGHGDP